MATQFAVPAASKQVLSQSERDELDFQIYRMLNDAGLGQTTLPATATEPEEHVGIFASLTDTEILFCTEHDVVKRFALDADIQDIAAWITDTALESMQFIPY